MHGFDECAADVARVISSQIRDFLRICDALRESDLERERDMRDKRERMKERRVTANRIILVRNRGIK